MPFKDTDVPSDAAASADRVAALFPIVYDELQRLAQYHLRYQQEEATLSTSSLVHEAYLRLATQKNLHWESEAHFCAIAARAMRQILISYARQQQAQKRGGGQRPITLSALDLAGQAQTLYPIERLLSIDAALDQLAQYDTRMGQLVECRFFAGMSMQETATALGLPLRTVERLWRRARLYLADLLSSAPPQ